MIGKLYFLTCSCRFLNPNNFSQFELWLFNFLDVRNLTEQVKKAFCYQKSFWPFTVWSNCSSDLKIFVNFRTSASNFKTASCSLAQAFLSISQNNVGNKISFLLKLISNYILQRKILLFNLAWLQNGQTALSIAQRLGYISVVETLKVVTEQEITTTTTTTIEEKYKVLAPESMQETFMSDSEDEGGKSLKFYSILIYFHILFSIFVTTIPSESVS